MNPRALRTLCLASTLLAGCQSTLLRDDRIAHDTAAVIGADPANVTITERASDGPTNTTYIAHDSQSGTTYSCIINGGGLLAAGMTNPPQCTKRP